MKRPGEEGACVVRASDHSVGVRESVCADGNC